jgi:hypothetical protein
MATNVTALVNLVVRPTRTITGGNLSTPTDAAVFTFPQTTYASGTAGGSLEEEWHGTVTVNGTNTTTLDLSDTTGAGLNMQGGPVAFTKIKLMFAFNRSTNSADVVTVGGGSNAWDMGLSAGATMTLNPGEARGFADIVGQGHAVTAGAGDLLRFVSAGTNVVSIDLILAGNKS